MRSRVTLGCSLYSHEGLETFTVEQLYEIITAPCGFIRSKTLDIQRSGWNQTLQEKLKNELPIVLANGVFDKRLNGNLITYSKYVMIDCDYDLSTQRAQRDADLIRIKSDPISRLVFLSPRGGIKVLVEHNNVNSAHHAELYDSVAAHFGITTADMKCRDLARANLIPYDPNAYLNPTSKVFKFTPLKAGSAVVPYTPKRDPRVATIKKVFNRFDIKAIPVTLTSRIKIQGAFKTVLKWSEKKFPVAKGARNSNLFTFACALHDLGVAVDDAIFLLTAKYVADDFLGNEIEKVIKNAYK